MLMLRADYQRVTHPFATNTILLSCPFDLHVLGAPPAFTLSQDQTLQKKYNRINSATLCEIHQGSYKKQNLAFSL